MHSELSKARRHLTILRLQNNKDWKYKKKSTTKLTKMRSNLYNLDRPHFREVPI